MRQGSLCGGAVMDMDSGLMLRSEMDGESPQGPRYGEA